MSVIAPTPVGSSVALDRAELGGHASVEDADALPAQELQELLRLLVRHHEFDLDGHVRRELEKVLLVQDAMPAETRDRPECRPAVNAEPLRLFEKPFEQRDVLVSPI